MMIRKRVLAVTLFLSFFLPSGMALAMGSDVAIHAGLAKRNPDGAFVIYKNTTSIPFVARSANPDYYFGVSVSAASGRDMACHMVLYLPNPNSVHGDVGDDMGDALISSVPYHVVQLQEVDGPLCETYMRLDDNDAPGNYIVEAFIGGKMAQRVVFNVQPK